MSHIDPDQLALTAMGEPVATLEESDHLTDCAVCSDELFHLLHAVEVGRATIDVGDLEAPGPAVWERIVDELRLGAMAVGPAAAPAPVSRKRVRSRGRLRTTWMLAAAVGLIAAAGLGTWGAVQWTALTPIAEAALDPFPDHVGAEGSAVVEQGRSGDDVVRVTLNAATSPDSYREVWLITADASALISLGVLDGNEGTFPIPAGVDLRQYVLVDISEEPIDGDPNHSGDSIVRGELAFDSTSDAADF